MDQIFDTILSMNALNTKKNEFDKFIEEHNEEDEGKDRGMLNSPKAGTGLL